MVNDIHTNEVPLARKASKMGMLIHRYYQATAQQNGALGDPLRGQGRILALLSAKPETTQRELSFVLDMRQQSLSELLSKLEEKGYVTREKSPDDGRVTVVKLTPAGANAAPTPDSTEKHSDALDVLTVEERDQFEMLVDKINSSLTQKLDELGVDAETRRDHGPHRGPHDAHKREHGIQRGPWRGAPRADKPNFRGPLRQA